MPKVLFPNGNLLEVPAGTTVTEAIRQLSRELLHSCIAAEVDGRAVDLSFRIGKDCKLIPITFDSPLGKEIFWHSSAHLLAHAVVRLFPRAKPTIGPPIEEGFYYDFADIPPLTPEDLQKIEEEMAKIVREDLPIRRLALSREEAKKMFFANPFKLEMIDEIPDGEHSIYYSGNEWFDLCRGPHLPSTGLIRAFKLTKVSSAYWRGDSSKDQLQRIYGISFPEKKMLDDYLARVEEAERRDHRKLGTQLGLFMFHEWSPGSPFFLPHGAIIYNEIVSFLRTEYIKRGYKEVITPQLFNKSLWEKSGHWQFYKENMFILQVDETEFSLKPMNCPSHVLIYNSTAHSYRDLPLRLADFGALHRNELRGVLSGMTRVRKFSQDDAHIFCTLEQIESEIDALLDFVRFVYVDTFHFTFQAKLSTRPEKFMGEVSQWEAAERYLEAALKKNNIPYVINAGDGAFYGPKIDFDVKDALGRAWQLATIQIDFQMPLRFGCQYEGADGRMHTPVMLHRAIVGSLERFVAILTENYAGKFPVWLSPIQVALLSVSDQHNNYAESLAATMRQAGIRAEANCKQETIGAKIRDAQLQKIPYMLVIGQKEKESGRLAVRTRDGKIENDVPIDRFIEKVKGEIAARAV
ncbi:MAG: threonine--tRNA ligase [Candidatus Micrarchaeota archaeon]|nr:threonine--tRNA ligase [Candidatus Micrarchaeota archaeon]